MSSEDDIRSRVRAVDQRFMDAFNAGDIAGAARAVYSRDAVLLPPGAAMIRGRDAIVEFWSAAAPQMGVERVELTTLALTPAGEFVHQVGQVLLTLRDGQEARGKYVVFWKEEDGDLRWHVDIWNMDE